MTSRKTHVATLHIRRDGVILDGRLPLKTYIELVSLLFPDETIKHAIIENTAIAPKPNAKVFEIQLINGEIPKPQPNLTQSMRLAGVDLPWMLVGWKDNWDIFLHPIEVKIYNFVR